MMVELAAHLGGYLGYSSHFAQQLLCVLAEGFADPLGRVAEVLLDAADIGGSDDGAVGDPCQLRHLARRMDAEPDAYGAIGVGLQFPHVIREVWRKLVAL